MNAQEARDFLGEENDLTLFADGFDDAFIGLGRRNHQWIAIYSEPIALEIISKQAREDCEDCKFGIIGDCDHWTDAREHFEFNVVGAYVGEGTPLWLDYDGDLRFE